MPSLMTSFDDRYRLLKCVALGGGMRTHNAQEKSTGRPVMVHILDEPEPDLVERLRAHVNALASADRSRIVEMVPTPNGFAVVSEFLAGLTTFPDWLSARAPMPAAAAPMPAAAPTPPAPEPAEALTQLIPAPVEPPPPAADPAPARGMASGPTESFVIGRIESSRGANAKGVQPPGEFTRLFAGTGGESDAGVSGAPAPVAAAIPTPSPVLAAPAAPTPTPSPVVAAPRAATPAAPTPPTPVPATPAPNAAPAPPPVAKVAPPPPSREPPPLAPGEFTALFRPLGAPTARDAAPSPLVGGTVPPPARSPAAPAAPPFAASPSAAFAAPPPSAREPYSALGGLAGPAAGEGSVRPSPFVSGGPPPLAPRPPAPSPQSPAPAPAQLGSSPLGVAPSPLIGGSNVAPLPPVIPPPVFTTPGGGAPGVPASPLSGRGAPAAGPSDYTMLIRQSETPAPPAAKSAAPAPAAQPATPKRPVPLGLIIALNVVLVLTIALVLYFVFRPTTPNADAGGALPAGAKLPAVQAPAPPPVPAIPKPAKP